MTIKESTPGETRGLQLQRSIAWWKNIAKTWTKGTFLWRHGTFEILWILLLPISDRLSRSIGLPLASRLSGPTTVLCTDLSGACQAYHCQPWQPGRWHGVELQGQTWLQHQRGWFLTTPSGRRKSWGSRDQRRDWQEQTLVELWIAGSSTFSTFDLVMTYGRYVWLRNL